MIKKLLITNFIIAFTFTNNFSQCVVNTNLVDLYLMSKGLTTGAYPDVIDNLDTAYVGVPYNQVLSFKLPTSVTSGSITADMCEVKVNSVVGMPSWGSYVCGNSNCTWDDLSGSGSPYGCVSISGTPTTAGVFNVSVPLDIKAKAGISFNQCKDITSLPFSQPQEVMDGYRIVVIDRQASSINKINNLHDIKLYPNPTTKGNSTFLSYNTTIGDKIEVTTINTIGKTINSKSFYSVTGKNSINLKTENLTNGIYFFKIKIGADFITKKLVIRN